MTQALTASTAHDLLRAFLDAESPDADPAFTHLADSLWTAEHGLGDGVATVVPDIIASLDSTDTSRRARLMVLLGVVFGAADPADGEVTAAVRAGVEHFLDQLRCGPSDVPLVLSALYLLAHFPDDRERIMPVVTALGLDAEDLSRVDRALTPFDDSDPAEVSLGRTFPSPAEWTSMSDEDRAFDRSWIPELTAEQRAGRWHDDTVMILTYAGGKAYWAAKHGVPTIVRDSSPLGDPRDLPEATDDRIHLFERHSDILRCADCAGELLFDDTDVRCLKCGLVHPIRSGVLDLLPANESMLGGADHAMATAATMKRVGYYYENVARPGFLRLVGSNWDGLITPTIEDGYLASRLEATDGTVLDIGAGAGRWTTVIEQAVGSERLIALDPNPVMLAWLRKRSPKVPCLQASGLSLPFTDGSLGAVNFWNALQAVPDPKAALAEIGRCLRPGGVLTLMTYQLSADPIYRYFQTTSTWPGHPNGLDLYSQETITGWLADAGLTVRELDSPGTMLLLTADRDR